MPATRGVDDLRVAERVLSVEAAGLAALARALDESFVQAVEILLKLRGRVIVSGMGKSGHVARKIAATLASTGQPAQFVHPAEASHGDLGMIGREDGVIMLSYSGETLELGDIIAHTRRFSIPLIGIAARQESALVAAADVALVLPPFEEACAIGLAPTTSTTMMIALGDALAVACMERRGFSRDDYKVLHPGGQLGRRLAKVSELMHRQPGLPLIGPDANLRDVLLTMSEGGLGCAGVIDDKGRIIGALSDGDIRRVMLQSDSLDRKAASLMSPSPKAIRAGALGAEAVQVMSETGRGISWLFVVSDDVDPAAGPYLPLGIIHIKDCLKAGIA